jgi:hypothetical protein
MPAEVTAMYPILLVLALALLLAGLSAAPAANYPEDLPAAEKAIAGSVDPWGLPFSDSLRGYLQRFGPELRSGADSRFALGVTHDLVKVWPLKYWFRGESVGAAAGDGAVLQAGKRWAAAGETQSFQVVVLPRLGAAEATYRVTAAVEGAAGATVEVFRQYFVKTAPVTYPRYGSERWPDPLTPAAELTVSGMDCGAFWLDVKLPASLPAGTARVTVTVTDGEQDARLVVPIQVVPGLDLRPKDFPLVAWYRDKYGSKTLSQDQMLGMGALVLEHHMQAMDLLQGRFDPAAPAEFDATHQFLAERGQNVFQLDSPSDKFDYRLLYDHVKQAGWLDQALIYSNLDEPLAEDFRAKNVPWRQDMQAKYPGLRVFLASAGHEKMAQGCDIWMTDLSTAGYEPDTMRALRAPTLWHYYCHLPIHIQFRAPLTMAPNMEVDCEALQHRLALWMSDYYGAKGVFIWAGFWASGLSDDFWTKLELETTPGDYPYGGLHSGNNFLVYPPQTDGGPVMPSVRLKVLRDGMEDLALLRAAERLLAEGKVDGARAGHLRELLDPTPGVFVHPQYWDRLPETLLERREAILRLLADVLEAM